ncbi:MAG: RuBisCO large subunit C-terminal-like domain-containing protein [Acetobacteraceae bacterium]
MLAGEQASGTFVPVPGETDALRERARARVLAIEPDGDVARPRLPNAFLARRNIKGPYHCGVIRIGFPLDNVGVNLPTLAATVAGNIYDLGEMTGVRLLGLDLPAEYAARYPGPRHGVAGTRRLAGIGARPVIGTIIKPNVGLTPADTAELVRRLCAAGIDFIKDDEMMANPPHAPLAERVAAVMHVVNAEADRLGRKVMVAFNVSDERRMPCGATPIWWPMRAGPASWPASTGSAWVGWKHCAAAPNLPSMATATGSRCWRETPPWAWISPPIRFLPPRRRGPTACERALRQVLGK